MKVIKTEFNSYLDRGDMNIYKRNRASGNSGEKIACGKIMRVN